jgi:ESS family glutamate:Na+ symporter
VQISLNILLTLALSIFLFYFGQTILRKSAFLRRSFIPAPVLGGLIFALINLIGHLNGQWLINLDTSLQIPAMSGFFATIGLTVAFQGSGSLGRRGLRYWLLCGLIIVGQNALGVLLATLMGISPFLGVLAGSASMVGGHGLAVSIGPAAEALGVPAALATAVASATFGLVAGAFLGGPAAKKLMERDSLQSNPNPENTLTAKTVDDNKENFQELLHGFNLKRFLMNGSLLALLLVLSSVSAPLLEIFFPELTIPSSVSAMVFGLIAGLILKKWPLITLHKPTLLIFQHLFLVVFLSMASMSLLLWELADLAFPLFIILLAQCLFTVWFSMQITYKFMGKDYNAAVMSAGMIGHALGATPTAIANMEAITDQHGPADDAFLLVPLGGGFLGDLINVPLVLFLLNLLT